MNDDNRKWPFSDEEHSGHREQADSSNEQLVEPEASYYIPEEPPKKKWKTAKSVLIAFLAGAVTLGGWGYALGSKLAANEMPSDLQATMASSSLDKGQVKQSDLTIPVGGPNTIADIVDKVGPAVVRIGVTAKASGGQSNPFMNDPFFRQFFGEQNLTPNNSQEVQGLGTGFIISKDGYILTNEHVIDNATDMEVTVKGYDKPFKAKLVGSDFELDLAVLKIDVGKDLPVLKMGNSDQVRVGDWVIAIGNPYDYDHTVTVGVVSAKGRPVGVEDRQYKNLLQTDASINPGNSGGPLLNLNGEVVGINTAINAKAQGIGFAIPTSTVQGVLKQLIEKGKVVRPWLGVQIQSVDSQIAKYFNLDKVEGAIVADVVKGSPAAKAGLKRGDIVLEINKELVKDASDLVDKIHSIKIGDSAILLIKRNGQDQYVTLTIEAKPANVR